jgi:hypothetical protein
MDELAGHLGRERRLLEVLLYKLVVVRQLLAAGEARFVAWAAAEVERAVERVREAELVRAALVARLAAELGVPTEELTLRALAEGAAAPWRAIFDDHRRAFLELVAEIEAVAGTNRKLAGQGLAGINDVIDMIQAGQGTGPATGRIYGPDHQLTDRRAQPAPLRVDRVI